MIDFVEEIDVIAALHSVDELLQIHKDEVNRFGDDIELDPDWKRYHILAELGILHIVTARDDLDETVGYCCTILTRHLHYDFKIAVNDIIFLTKPYRGYAIKLLRFVEDCLKRKGVNIHSIAIKPHLDFSPVVKRMGYELLEYQYFRRIQ